MSAEGGREMREGIIEPEPTWKSQPEWLFWLEYLKTVDPRQNQAPSIQSFRHLPQAVKFSDENRVRVWYERFSAERQAQREKRERGEMSEEALAARELDMSLGPTGHLLEGILVDLIEERQMFGDAVVLRASRFDDLFNGVDAVLEWARDAQYGVFPRLAVDFSVSNSSNGTGGKKAKRGEAMYVKYLRSHFERGGGRARELSLDVPGVVIRVPRDAFKAAARAAMERGEKADSHDLAVPELRRMIVEQTSVQMSKRAVDLFVYLRGLAPHHPPIDAAFQKLLAGEPIDTIVPALLQIQPRDINMMTKNQAETSYIVDFLAVWKSVKNAAQHV